MSDRAEPGIFDGGGEYNSFVPMNDADRRTMYRRSALRRQYDISLEDLARIIAYQDGCCALCLLPLAGDNRLSVDHDHDNPVKRDSVRGILHHACNLTLGRVEKIPLLISDHVRAYLEKPPAREALRGIPAVHPDFKRYRRARLDVEEVQEIRCLKAEGMSRKELAERFGVSVANIKTILGNKTWQDQPVYVQQQTKLDMEKAREIRRLRAEGAEILDLAERFGVSDQTIWSVVNGKTWRESAP